VVASRSGVIPLNETASAAETGDARRLVQVTCVKRHSYRRCNMQWVVTRISYVNWGVEPTICITAVDSGIHTAVTLSHHKAVGPT
jgi:hypothetical protein